MKKLIICLSIIGVSFAAGTQYQPKPNTAEVENVGGWFIFTDSKPVMKYEYLGSVKKDVAVWSANEV